MTGTNWHGIKSEWMQGERIAPITIDCSLTRRCTYKCVYCYETLQANDEKKLTQDVIYRFLDDASDAALLRKNRVKPSFVTFVHVKDVHMARCSHIAQPQPIADMSFFNMPVNRIKQPQA